MKMPTSATPVTMVLVLGYLLFMGLADPLNPRVEQLLKLGALQPQLVAEGEAWRLLSYSVLHGGPLHIILNLMGLLNLGPAIEQRLGSTRFALLYLVAALGGAIAVVVTNPPWTIVVGGSGSLFGMLGAAVALHMRMGRHLLEFLDTYGGRQLVSVLLLNYLMGFMIPVVSNAGHTGGLIAGFALTFYFYEPGRQEPDAWTRVTQLAWVLLLISWTAFCIWWLPAR